LDLSNTAFHPVNRSQESSLATGTFASSFNLRSLTSSVQFCISYAIWSSTSLPSSPELSPLPPSPPSSLPERFPSPCAIPCATAMAGRASAASSTTQYRSWRSWNQDWSLTGRNSSSSFFRYNLWTLLECSRKNFRLLDLSVQCLHWSPSKTGRRGCGVLPSGGSGTVLYVYGYGKSATYASICRRSSSFVL